MYNFKKIILVFYVITGPVILGQTEPTTSGSASVEENNANRNKVIPQSTSASTTTNSTPKSSIIEPTNSPESNETDVKRKTNSTVIKNLQTNTTSSTSSTSTTTPTNITNPELPTTSQPTTVGNVTTPPFVDDFDILTSIFKLPELSFQEFDHEQVRKPLQGVYSMARGFVFSVFGDLDSIWLNLKEIFVQESELIESESSTNKDDINDNTELRSNKTEKEIIQKLSDEPQTFWQTLTKNDTNWSEIKSYESGYITCIVFGIIFMIAMAQHVKCHEGVRVQQKRRPSKGDALPTKEKGDKLLAKEKGDTLLIEEKGDIQYVQGAGSKNVDNYLF